MIHLKKNASIVIKTIEKYRYGPRAIRMSKDCYDSLLLSMEKEGIATFSIQYALDWCQEEVARSRQPLYYSSIQRLADVYEYGKVRANHLVIYSHPSEGNCQFISSYIKDVSDEGRYSQVHLENIRHAVTQFCCFAEYNGIAGIDDLGYDILEQYDMFLRESSKAFFISEGLVSGFLKHLANRKTCSPGYGLFMHYIKSGRCSSLKELSPEAVRVIETRRIYGECFPASEFYESIPDFTEKLSDAGYSKAVTSAAPYHLNLLYLFLDREGLGYDRIIVEYWFAETGRRLFRTSVAMARRTYEMYDDYTREGDVLPSHRWKHGENAFDRLPSWCKEEVGAFVGYKQKEGWARSTVSMFQTCATKFCRILDETGVRSFGEITPSDIKEFNIHDRHQTPEAKNAYNSRIRKFLIYLELKRLVPAGIHFALPNHAAAWDRIVETLSDEDVSAIRRYCGSASTPIGLRDSAILLIALDTGLRSCDIVGLKISCIDWKERCLRITQQKTGVESTFPLETSTCNAIYKYLKDVRRRGTRYDSLFLGIKAPFSPAGRSACRDALLRAGASTGRTHLARKTFGSMILNSGSSVEETAMMLGHSDTSTVHKYASLDSRRSRLCPLSLSETGLSLEGRYGYHA